MGFSEPFPTTKLILHLERRQDSAASNRLILATGRCIPFKDSDPLSVSRASAGCLDQAQLIGALAGS
jgi:hypothetical protein